MNDSRFQFSGYLSRVTSLRNRLTEALRTSGDPKVERLVAEVPDCGVMNGESAAPLTLAFVGQYNAGKSTIISALTGKGDIPIDADVCTQTVTAYDWEGIKLLDTPGIHAGYRSHDEQTYRTIESVDLLVFVITSELFDDVIGAQFRQLAFERRKAQEMVLVVNKMGQDAGSAEDKRSDIEKVTRPLPMESFRTVFIDALSYVEALEEAEVADRAELLDIARFERMECALNSFVDDRGLMGRLTTPLFRFGAVAGQGEAYLSVEMPEERAALELLERKQGLFISSQQKLRSNLSSLVATAASEIVAYGDQVAETIEPGNKEDGVRGQFEDAEQTARERRTRLYEDVRPVIESELSEIKRQLDALHNGVLAQDVRGRVKTGLTRTVSEGDGDTGLDFGSRTREKRDPSDWQRRLTTVGIVMGDIGKIAEQWTTGPHAQGARMGSATAARGSQGHKVVYKVGKFFGHKFRPHEAENMAKSIGNVGRATSALSGVLMVIGQIAQDRQQEKQSLQLRDARDTVRSEFRKEARSVEQEFWGRFEEFSQDFYENEIAAVDDRRSEIVGDRDRRTGTSKVLGAIRAESMELVENIRRVTGL